MLSRIGILAIRNNFRLISSSNVVALSTSSTSSKNHYDIVIVGGGMVGGTLASALGKYCHFDISGKLSHSSHYSPGQEKVLANKSILLLEGAPKFKGFSVDGEYSNRVSTLNSGTLRLLDSIGAWERIKSVRANPVYDMQVSANSTQLQCHPNTKISRSGTHYPTPLSPSTKDPIRSPTSLKMISSWTLSTSPSTLWPTSP